MHVLLWGIYGEFYLTTGTLRNVSMKHGPGSDEAVGKCEN